MARKEKKSEVVRREMVRREVLKKKSADGEKEAEISLLRKRFML